MLVNKNSGQKNSKARLVDVVDMFCSKGYDVTAYVTQAKGDAKRYLIKSRTHYDLVCVFGGDGTMNEVSNALMKKKYKPMLAYFPSGTMNDFGSNFDLDADIVKTAERVCEKNIKYFDVGKINNQYFNYVAAFGAMCDVPYTTDRGTKEVLGNIAYILEGLSKVPDIKSHHVKYYINGKSYESDALFGLIYSGSRVAGMQLESKENAQVDDGYFNVLIVDYVPSLFGSPDLISTVLSSDKYIHRYHCKKIKLDFDDDVVWTIDGEDASHIKHHVDIEIINKALSLYA